MNMWRSKQNQAGSFLFACSVGVVRGLRRLCLCCLLVYTSAYIWVNEFVCPRCVQGASRAFVLVHFTALCG